MVWESLCCVTLLFTVYERLIMAVLREIPHDGRFHRPRYPDLTFEEAMDRTSDPLILINEREGSPIRDIAIGRVHVVQFSRSSQLDLNISMIRNFVENRENWTREADDYVDSEKNFAKSLLTILCYVKRNIDWSVGGKPPINRDAYEALMQCYDFEPFRKYWSRGTRMRAVGYRNTVKFYYENVNFDSQAQMLHRLQRENGLIYTGV